MSYLVKIAGTQAGPYSSELHLPVELQGSSVEVLDASPGQEEVQFVSTPRYSGCFGLPYQDHNYGAPPPPTPPASPPPQRLNGHLVVEDAASIPQPAKEETVDDSVTRCICEFQHDDGYMICCDQCSVWQHIDCMGIDRNNIPESYYCELCQSRPVDVERAKMIQSCRREEMTDTSATDTDPEEAANHLASLSKKAIPIMKGKGVKQKKVAARGKEKSAPKQRRKEKKIIKKEKENIKEVVRKQRGSANGQIVQEVVMGPKQSKTKSRRKTASPPPDISDPYNSSISPWTDKFEFLTENSYSAQVKQLLSTLKLNGLHPDDNAALSSKLPVQLCRLSDFKKNRKGLEATERIAAGLAVIEYVGNVMHREQYEKDYAFYKRLQPFVLFYPKLENLDLCIETASCGNEARYVRRSCAPNAEVRHLVEDGKMHLLIYAKKDIAKGSEITIPFDYNYQACSFCVECACLRNNCLISKFWKKLKNAQTRNLPGKPQRTRRQSGVSLERKPQPPVRRSSTHAASKRASTEQPPSDPVTVVEAVEEAVAEASKPVEPEPPRPKVSRRASAPSAPVEASQPEPVEVKEEPPQLPDGERRVEGRQDSTPDDASESDDHARKMTREERKMEAIMKAIEKMEKREERRKEALARIEHAKKDTKPAKQTSEDVPEVPEEKPSVTPDPKPESPQKTVKGKRARRLSRRRSRMNSGSAVWESTLSQDESSSTSTSVPSAPTTPVPVPAPPNPQPSPEGTVSEAVKAPKKKHLIAMMERHPELKPTPVLVSAALCRPEPLEVAVEDAMFVTCLPSPRNAMEHLQRRNSHSAGCGKSLDSSIGSAKKRWLRQAMSTEGEGTPSVQVAATPSLVSQLHSPESSPPTDFLTPLKKRRFARESLSQDHPAMSYPSTPSPSRMQQEGPDFPCPPAESWMPGPEPARRNGLLSLLTAIQQQAEGLCEMQDSGRQAVEVKSDGESTSTASAAAPALVSEEEEESRDGMETSSSLTDSQGISCMEMSSSTTEALGSGTVESSEPVASLLALGGSEARVVLTGKRVEVGSAEASCVIQRGCRGSPGGADTSSGRSSATQLQDSSVSEKVSFVVGLKLRAGGRSASSLAQTKHSNSTETSSAAEAGDWEGGKGVGSMVEWEDLNNLESSSASTQCTAHGTEPEMFRTDDLAESSEVCEVAEERTLAHISSSQGFVPSATCEPLSRRDSESCDPVPNNSCIDEPMETSDSDVATSHRQKISSSADLPDEVGVCSSNSGLREAADSNSGDVWGGGEACHSGSATASSSLGGSLQAAANSSRPPRSPLAAAPQDSWVSSCSQEVAADGESGITSSHAGEARDWVTSAGSEVESGECDSSVPGEVKARQSVAPRWEEECRVDSTTQGGDGADQHQTSTSSALCPEGPDPAGRPASSHGNQRSPSGVSSEVRPLPSLQSQALASTSGSLDWDPPSSHADSASAQKSARKKVSLLEYRKRLKEKGKEAVGSTVVVSRPSVSVPEVFPQQPPPAEELPTLAPLPLFTASPSPNKASSSSKGSLAGQGRRRDKPMSLTERLRLEFGLEDSEEEEKGQPADVRQWPSSPSPPPPPPRPPPPRPGGKTDDEDVDSGPSQKPPLIPPPPPSTPYPSHLAGSRLPSSSSSRTPPLIPLVPSRPLRPSSPASSSPLLPTPSPQVLSPHSATPLLPFPGGSPRPPSSLINGNASLYSGASKSPAPASSFPQPSPVQYVPPPPPGQPTALPRRSLASPARLASAHPPHRTGLGNGFSKSKQA